MRRSLLSVLMLLFAPIAQAATLCPLPDGPPLSQYTCSAESVNLEKLAQAFGTAKPDVALFGHQPGVAVHLIMERVNVTETDPNGLARIRHEMILTYPKAAIDSIISSSLPAGNCEFTSRLLGTRIETFRDTVGRPAFRIYADIRTHSRKCSHSNPLSPWIRKTVGASVAITMTDQDGRVTMEASEIDPDERLSRLERASLDLVGAIGRVTKVLRWIDASGSMMMTHEIVKAADYSWAEMSIDPFNFSAASTSALAASNPDLSKVKYACRAISAMRYDRQRSSIDLVDGTVKLRISEFSEPAKPGYNQHAIHAWPALRQYVIALDSSRANYDENYVIRRGDSLWRIAESFYGDGRMFHVLSGTNEIAYESSLSAGETLIVPRYIDVLQFAQMVRGGESLWKVSNDYQESRPLFAALLRKAKAPDLVFPSQMLPIPMDLGFIPGTKRPRAIAKCGE